MPTEHVYLLTPKWSESIGSDPRTEPLFVVRPDGKGKLGGTLRVPAETGDRKSVNLMIGVPLNLAGPIGVPGGRTVAWGFRKLGPGTWVVEPSVVAPEYGLHAFIVVCEVPNPAPWEPQLPIDPDMPADPRKPTHRCKVCQALWKLNGPDPSLPDSHPCRNGSWSCVKPGLGRTWGNPCGPCCDNVPMGDQIEALP